MKFLFAGILIVFLSACASAPPAPTPTPGTPTAIVPIPPAPVTAVTRDIEYGCAAVTAAMKGIRLANESGKLSHQNQTDIITFLAITDTPCRDPLHAKVSAEDLPKFDNAWKTLQAIAAKH